MLPLHELQSRFFAQLSHGLTSGRDGKDQVFDPTLVQVVQAGNLNPEERISIYANMYRARLVDVLSDDFAQVAAVLGEQRFSEVAVAYLAAYPSTHPSIQYIGRQFANFLATRAACPELPFLGDLARLEWARVEVFGAPDAEPLQLAQLQTIAPDEWAELRFQLIPACRILSSAWPIHKLWDMDSAASFETIHPVPTCVRVWRTADFTTYQASMDAAEQAALRSLQAGEPFAAICATLEETLPVEEAAQAVGSLLLRWIEDGLLAQLPES